MLLGWQAACFRAARPVFSRLRRQSTATATADNGDRWRLQLAANKPARLTTNQL